MSFISIEPSGNWAGNAGNWSTFSLQIGDPAQAVEVLPATSKSNIWAVDPAWCPNITSVGDCADFRGGLFEWQASTTFTRIVGNEPYWNLPFDQESPLGYAGLATFGTDLVRFGPPDGGGDVLVNQTIAAFAYTTPFLATGLLGLSDESQLVDEVYRVSPLRMLRDTKRISSLFWAYNAGVRYLDPYVAASLTLGGYDVNRGGELKDALKVPMQRYNERDLLVSVAISFDNGKPQNVSEAVNAYIDSVVPDLWLPESVCQVFEREFHLQWNETAQMYLLDEDHRRQLYASDSAKVNFTLSVPFYPGKSTIISLAYQAFDFAARYPLAGIEDNTTLYYFPLKRANDSSQYYLGHAFLQEAYLAVDYDRSEFYLSQANLLDANSRPDITTVYPPGHKSLSTGTGQPGSLSTGAIAGIIVGVVIVALVAASTAAWFWCRPRWRKRRNSRFRERMEAQNFGLPNTQLPPSQETEMQEYYAKRPLSPDSDIKQELDATTTARGSITTRAEMESPGQSVGGSPRSKMGPRRTSYGFPSSPVELESRSPRMMHSRNASGSSIEPMSPLTGVHRTELGPTEEVHELP